MKRSAVRELDSVEPRAQRRRSVAPITALSDDPRPPGVAKLAGERSRWRLRQAAYREKLVTVY